MASLPFANSKREYIAAMKAFQGILQGIANNTRLSTDFLATAKPQVQAFYDYVQNPTPGQNAKINFPSTGGAYKGEISKLRTALQSSARHILYSPDSFYDYSESMSTFMSNGFINIPDGVQWNLNKWPMKITVDDPGGFVVATGSSGYTPAENFNRVSTALTAPDVTYYVNLNTGNDSAYNGLTPEYSFLTLAKAIAVGNANSAATTVKVVITAGEYARNAGFAGNNLTKDFAFVTTGGKVVTGGFDAASVFAFTIDATYTNCYSMTLAAVERLLDRTDYNASGTMKEYVSYSVADLNALTTVSTSSMAIDGGKVYVRRKDGAAPSYTNTRLLRNVKAFECTNNVNVYAENIDLIGGGPIACWNYWPTTLATTDKILALDNCSGGYSAGLIGVPGRGISISNINGLAHLRGFRAFGNREDGINGHVYIAGCDMHVLTEGCVGFDNGRYTGQSNQGHTMHEYVKWTDIAGRYQSNRGQNGAMINDTLGFTVSTLWADGLGDQMNGGAIAPTCFTTANNAKVWSWKSKFRQTVSQQCLLIRDNSVFYDHGSVFLDGAINGGSGTITKL